MAYTGKPQGTASIPWTRKLLLEIRQELFKKGRRTIQYTKKKGKFLWGTAAADTFQRLKESFISAPVLSTFDPEKETFMETDASDYALGLLLYRNLIYIAGSQLREKILHDYHDAPIHGHQGVEKTLERVSQNSYWLGLRTSVEKYIKTCM
jgi:hypothetical protein